LIVAAPTLLTLIILEQPQVVGAPHKAQLSHELIAAAASYEVYSFYYGYQRSILIHAFIKAAKAYEKHCADKGQPSSHKEATELL
jgi:hypothetical protein